MNIESFYSNNDKTCLPGATLDTLCTWGQYPDSSNTNSRPIPSETQNIINKASQNPARVPPSYLRVSELDAHKTSAPRLGPAPDGGSTAYAEAPATRASLHRSGGHSTAYVHKQQSGPAINNCMHAVNDLKHIGPTS